MSKLHLFYPENDLALAANVTNYTPPKAAMTLHRVGEPLPLWYGSRGDVVLCHGVNARWLDSMAETFDLGTDVYDHQYRDGLEPAPWGWSLASRQFLIDDGVPADALPGVEAIEKMRQLSHRRTAAAIAARLADMLPGLPLAPAAVEADDCETAERIIAEYGDAVVKAPWSSSGRGVANSRLVGNERAVKMACDAIRRQGSVMIEHAYDRAIDFAKIYVCEHGKCRFHSTSVFVTDQKGAYLGNVLASECMRMAKIAPYADPFAIEQITEAIRLIIEEMIAPYYDGVLGMDMLVDTAGMIDAAVELNLRHTMGYVANRIADEHVADGAGGVFKVVAGSAVPTEFVVEGNKLAGGTLQLIPANPHFSMQACINTK